MSGFLGPNPASGPLAGWRYLAGHLLSLCLSFLAHDIGGCEHKMNGCRQDACLVLRNVQCQV
jgi:hypothetical protein